MKAHFACRQNNHITEMELPPMTKEKFMELVTIDTDSGCWIWNRCRHYKDGYGKKSIGGRKGMTISAHRLSWWVFKGEYPKLYVCHHCDNRPCCNPDHLFLGTSKDNMQDAWKKGRLPLPTPRKGENHHSGKLKEYQVREIKQAINNGEPLKSIAMRYGVSYQNILYIRLGKIWKSVIDSRKGE